MRARLKQFFVVIGFNHERVYFAQALHQHLRRVTEIGDKPEPRLAVMKGVADRFHGIVRHGECLHCDVADGKVCAGAKEPPVWMSGERTGADRFRGESVAINRDTKFPTKHLESADVIAVFMREQDAIELIGRHPAEREPEDELARAQPAIDEKPAMIGREEGGVPRAPAPEHREAEHARYITGANRVHKQNCGRREAR